MSETKQNSNAVEAQPLIIVKQKSALVGFLLAFIGLGWFGIDRFYKGDKWLGLLKLVSSINCIVMFLYGAFAWLVAFINSDLSFFESFILFVKGMFQAIIKEGFSSEFCFVLSSFLSFFHMFIWWPADFILVPLGIVIDNKRKLAKANAVEIK